ncbi:MAG: ribosomal RNA small subunit methyltransferase A [Verrucomicrobia bacterium]|nr:ribosomal RNA small subunit methyltransferase A [Verrucomicrobiota bacterium]
MNLTRPTEVRSLLKQMDFHPSKALGQNFLTDGNIVNLIVNAADLSAEDNVIEVGPGLGVLTEAIAARAHRVLAIEKDHRLCGHLREYFAGVPNIDIHEGDALGFDFHSAALNGYSKFISNLPYSTGNRILVELFQMADPPELIVITVQKDVGDRLTAGPGTKNYGLLTVWAQAGYETAARKSVSPSCFTPPPRVQSSVLVLKRRMDPLRIENRELFSLLIKACFEKRRKQIGTILRDAPSRIHTVDGDMERILTPLRITPRMRPEEISVEQWIGLANTLSARTSD